MSLNSINLTFDKFKIRSLMRKLLELWSVNSRTFILALNIRLRLDWHLKLRVGKRLRVIKVTSPEINGLNEGQDCVNEIDIDGS